MRMNQDDSASDAQRTNASQIPWNRKVGNFGFGFIFLGALLNAALLIFITAFGFESLYLYKPRWFTYLILSCITGWSWRHHGNRHLAEA